MEDNNIDFVRPFVKRLIENRIFDENLKWFRHEVIQRCFEDDLDDEERKSYHDRASKFFEGLQQQKQNRLNKEVSFEGEDYEIAISFAYHLHMAGRQHEKSYIRNKELGDYALTIGDLDVAERCYKRAIVDAKELGNLEYEIRCVANLSSHVYRVWGRYDEAFKNFQAVLEYYRDIGDRRGQATVLNSIALILQDRGEYKEAIKVLDESLEIAREIDDKLGISNSLANIANIHFYKGMIKPWIYIMKR